jgi:hypothetical protein
LSCDAFLVASSEDTGVIQAKFWLAAAAALLAHRRAGLAGVLAGLAVMTSLRVAPLVLGLLATTRVLGGRCPFTRALIGVALAVAALDGLGLAVGGRRFLEQWREVETIASRAPTISNVSQRRYTAPARGPHLT